MASKRRLSAKDWRKILLLAGLWILVLALAYAAYYFQQNRRLPVPALRDLNRAANAQQEPPRFLFNISGEGMHQLQRPLGVAVSKDERVYVADLALHRISVFDTKGKPLFEFSAIQDGENTSLRNPVAVAIRDDEVWVTDRLLRGIYVFDLSGKYLRKFTPTSEPEIVWSPLTLGFDRDGSIRIADVGDAKAHRIIYLTPDGQRALSFGETNQVVRNNESPGGFYFPRGIAVAKNGDVYVSDGNNRRVQVFSKNGEFVRFVTTAGVPRGIAFDKKDRFYVVDAVAHQVDIYSSDGDRIGKFGSQGLGAGQFNYPSDVAIGPDDQRIYVSDRENSQVQVWGWPVAAPPVIPVPREPAQWLWCLTPLLLLPLLLLLRRRRYVITPEWAETLIVSGNGDALKDRRVRFVALEADEPRFAALVLGDQAVSEYVRFEGFSDSDARAIESKLLTNPEEANVLAMSQRARGLLTEDERLREFAQRLEIRVYNVPEYLAERPLKKQAPDH